VTEWFLISKPSGASFPYPTTISSVRRGAPQNQRARPVQTDIRPGDIYTDTYKGWYCEGCEAFIQEKDLVDGKCPNHNRAPSWIEEQNYFFRLSAYGGKLLERIKADPQFIQPESRRNEIVRLIEGGLDDISVSRSGFDWGIPLPDDSGHVVYVWFDALINYISSLGFGSGDESLFDKYWPADLHVIGKDITRSIA
jgi:methionyl-tRNA synthetase